MMNIRSSIFVGFFFLIATAPVRAADDSVAQSKEEERDLITQGVRSGELTQLEGDGLERELLKGNCQKESTLVNRVSSPCQKSNA
jgi:hypothetical protein